MSEQDLISGLKNGNEHSYRELFGRYGTMVLNTILGMVPDRNEAEDLTQEVFIEVYKSVRNFRGESKVSTWLYRIAIRKSLDHIKSKKRKKRWGIFFRIGQEDGPSIDPFHMDHPGVELENKEEAEYLFKAIDALPDNQRTAFVLARIEGLKQEEVAAIMKISVGAVESLLSRAKTKLKEELNHIIK